MNLKSLGFEAIGEALSWRNERVTQVVRMQGASRIYGCCDVCIDAIDRVYGDEPADACVVCRVAWNEREAQVIPSWDLYSSNHAAKSTMLVEDFPAKAAEYIGSLRTAYAIADWLKGFSGKRPPAYNWLSMLAYYWAGDTKSALAHLDDFTKHYKAGSELREQGLKMEKLIKGKLSGGNP
jgi:hypothetical protein